MTLQEVFFCQIHVVEHAYIRMLLRLKSIIAGAGMAALCPGIITGLQRDAEQKRQRPGGSAEPQEVKPSI